MVERSTERMPILAVEDVFAARLARTAAVPLTYAGTKVLRTQAKAVAQAAIGTEDLQQLIATMVQTMRHARGVGLAAPQIGVDLAVAVLEDKSFAGDDAAQAHNKARARTALPLCVIINPQLRRLRGAGEATFNEGCLSVPHYAAEVRRDLTIEVQGLDARGEPFVWRPSGWNARIVQHEVDHLRGVLYVDRMASKTFSYLK